jgi:hypothetical protein
MIYSAEFHTFLSRGKEMIVVQKASATFGYDEQKEHGRYR